MAKRAAPPGRAVGRRPAAENLDETGEGTVEAALRFATGPSGRPARIWKVTTSQGTLPSPRPTLFPRPGRAPVASSPERSLLEAIASGELALQLRALGQAIKARLNLLHTIDSIDALAQLVVDDQVRINHHARPRFLEGHQGRIVALDSETPRSV